MKTFGEKANDLFGKLNPDFKLPAEIKFLLPYKNEEAVKLTKLFFSKFYNDTENRIFILGINPGRFGSGTTGIAFTDPVALENECGIKNNLLKKKELSSEFIYKMINQNGGVKKFYEKYFLSAVCPVGFTKANKNLNYYDDKNLMLSSGKFISESMKQQISFGASRKSVICLGEGKNYDYLKKLNSEFNFFEEIIPLPHPRFIMQYKRKKIDDYLQRYSEVLTKAI